MPPENTQPKTNFHPVTVTEQKCPWYQPLCKVTPLSKYLAAIIFILLPFVGAYIGYQIAPEKVVEVSTANSTSLEITKNPRNKTIRYIYPSDWNEFVQNEKSFSKILTLEDVSIIGEDEFVQSIGQPPYFLELLASSTDYKVFCLPPFGKGGPCRGLYKYSNATNELAVMQSSDLFNPFYTGGAFSPDNQKIAVVSELSDKDGGSGYKSLSVGVIDLGTDSYMELSNNATSSPMRFASCDDMTCTTDMKWTDNNSLDVTNYHMQCQAEDIISNPLALKECHSSLDQVLHLKIK